MRSFFKLSTDLGNKLTKWDTEVQNEKKEKYIRDSDDFRSGNIFKWQATPPPDPSGSNTHPLQNGSKSLPVPSSTAYNYPPSAPPPMRGGQVTRGNFKRGRGRGRGPPKTPNRDNHHHTYYQQDYRAPRGWESQRQDPYPYASNKGRRDTPQYTHRGQVPLYNRFAPLQPHGTNEGGDFLGAQSGPGRGMLNYQPNPGEWWKQQAQPSPQTRGPPLNRKEREETEGVGDYKKKKPH